MLPPAVIVMLPPACPDAPVPLVPVAPAPDASTPPTAIEPVPRVPAPASSVMVAALLNKLVVGRPTILPPIVEATSDPPLSVFPDCSLILKPVPLLLAA